MEPLRKCQNAQLFVPAGPQGQMLAPSPKYPNCPYCPMKLSTDPPDREYPRCSNCGSVRMTLYEVPTEKLLVPDVSMEDFEKALSKSGTSVSADELTRFVEWTREFGQEG
ncbi:unnamed protein product [Discosporangium mesarthrocarpum]